MTEERLRELLWELINCATDHNYEGIDAFQEQIVEEVMKGESDETRNPDCLCSVSR